MLGESQVNEAATPRWTSPLPARSAHHHNQVVSPGSRCFRGPCYPELSRATLNRDRGTNLHITAADVCHPAGLFSLTPAAFAEGTRTWEQSKFEELAKGTATGVAIRSVGGIELAPAFKAIYTAPSTYIWSIASDDAGNIYAAAGSPARVYRITPDGQATTIFEPTELQVQALVVDKNGVDLCRHRTRRQGLQDRTQDWRQDRRSRRSRILPDKSKGQVDPNWTSPVYFDPHTKYIWDIALDIRATSLRCYRRPGARFTGSPPRAITPCFSKATKPISACWPWIPKET